MGGKHSGGRDDRSDEYEDRRPPEEEREVAQKTVHAAAERAEEATGPSTGPDVDRETVEASLGIDLSETETATARSRPYIRLSEGQRETMRQTLSERYSDDAVKRVYTQLTNWKGSSQPRRDTQAHELAAKEALGIDASVRTRDDGEIEADEPSQEDVELYQELSAASKAIMQEHYGEQVRVYRAVRDASVATLTAQAIDKPDADEYYFSTSVLSNYTTEKAIAREFDGGIIVEGDARPDDIALATDQLKPHDSTIDEAEVHVKGGHQFTEAEGIKHSGRSTGEERPINETVSMMESPSELSISEHQDIAELVTKMSQNDTRVRTEQGADRVQQWFDAYEEHPDSDRRDTDQIKLIVDQVTIVDDRNWEHL